MTPTSGRESWRTSRKDDRFAVGARFPWTTLRPTLMSTQSVLDAVRRVEEAPLKDLVGVSVDDVEAQMDHLLEPEIDSASLYRRWGKQPGGVCDAQVPPRIPARRHLPPQHPKRRQDSEDPLLIC